MPVLGNTFRSCSVCLLLSTMALAQSAPSPSSPPAPQVPAQRSLTFDDYVDRTLQQEQRVVGLMRFYKPVVETYIQELKPDTTLRTVPKDDAYFLSRLDLTGNAPANLAFSDVENWKERAAKKLTKPAGPYAAVGFAQAVFPDLEHFDRQNYTFEFVRWEGLGEVRCAAMDVTPRAKTGNRGFTGRIWVEDRDFNIVRFTGTYLAKSLSQRSFHFDSWRLNLLGSMWLPAYVYSEESPTRDAIGRGLWFKAQTRIWGYDLQHAGDHREFAKPLTDVIVATGPARQEISQNLSAEFSLGKGVYTPEDNVVERLQVAGLMAPDGDVNRVLQTVVNNLQITNELDIAAVRCRVLLTSPLESFIVGRTIVVSRGLLDVLPDEATLAAVLSHELAHIVLKHATGDEYQSHIDLMFSDLETFKRLDFRLDESKELAADKKGLELLAKSPYQDQLSGAALFLQALQTRAPQLPNLLRGHFSNGFANSHLVGMATLTKSGPTLQMDRVDQIAALPIGSRIKVDPWSNRIELMKGNAVRPRTAGEKMPFEVAPLYPYLRRVAEESKTVAVKPR